MEQGLEPIRMRAVFGVSSPFIRRGVKPQELMHFSRQLAVFVRAGIPILDAIDGIAAGTDRKSFRETIVDVNDALRSGETLSEAFAEHPKVFPGYYVGAIRAAERTGNLDASLERLATYLERDIVNRRKVKSAFTYPLIVIVLGVIVVIVLTTFVIPRFQSFFDVLGTDLPWPTRVLMGVMTFLTAWGIFIAVAIVAAFVAASAVSRTPGGRALVDKLALKLPVLGDLLSTSIVERFCRALGSMVEAAVPLPEALDIAGGVTNNAVYRENVLWVRDRMLSGHGLSDPLEETDLFPSPVIQMVRSGEQTGTLDQQLITSAEYYGKELDYKLDRYTNLLEPVIIVSVGLVVGFVAVALVSAMYGMLGTVGL